MTAGSLDPAVIGYLAPGVDLTDTVIQELNRRKSSLPGKKIIPKSKQGASAVVQSQKTTYEIMDGKTVQSAFGKRLEVKIMLNAQTMPDENRIKIIAARVQRESKGTWRQASIEFYLPGLDLGEPAYTEVHFDESGLTEFWTRDTVIYGTKWSRHIQ